ncbi:MAG TPA: DUF3054 domain-containing protein [Gaiellaceae bacterium]
MRLAAAGAAAIVVFATIGQLSHRGGVSPGGYAADVLPLLACWLALAWWTKRFVPTWLGGVTLGVLARMVVLGHYRWNEAAFWLVSLVFVGALAAAILRIARRTSGPWSGDRTRLGRTRP